MGAQPDELTREIVEQRARIAERLSRLEQRMKSARQRATTTASSVADQRVQGLRIEHYVQEHPLVSVMGGLGLGVVLGAGSESVATDGAGLISNALSGLMSGPVTKAVQEEIQGLIREALSGRRGGSYEGS